MLWLGLQSLDYRACMGRLSQDFPTHSSYDTTMLWLGLQSLDHRACMGRLSQDFPTHSSYDTTMLWLCLRSLDHRACMGRLSQDFPTHSSYDTTMLWLCLRSLDHRACMGRLSQDFPTHSSYDTTMLWLCLRSLRCTVGMGFRSEVTRVANKLFICSCGYILMILGLLSCWVGKGVLHRKIKIENHNEMKKWKYIKAEILYKGKFLCNLKKVTKSNLLYKYKG